MRRKPGFYLFGMILLFIAVNIFGASYVDLYYIDILIGFIILLLSTISTLFFTIRMFFKNPEKWYWALLLMIITLIGIAGCLWIISLYFI